MALRLGVAVSVEPKREWAYPLPLRMDGLVVGAALAWRARTTEAEATSQAWWALAFAVAGIALLAGASPAVRFVFQLPVLVAAFGALVVLATEGALPWLRARWLAWLGTVSYGVYVIHYPMLGILERLGWKPTDLVSWSVRIGVGAGVSALLAWLSWHVVESPFLKLKGRFPMPGAPGIRTADVVAGAQDRTTNMGGP
jgi:peptidoglycan/LPS O-acetylase OafA/YrhL